MSAELKGCVTRFICFLDLLWIRYNCAKFHHCRIYVTDSREGGIFDLPPSLGSPKKAHHEQGLEQVQNTKNPERQKKRFSKEKVENTDLHKPLLNKIITTQEQCVKYNFVAPIPCHCEDSAFIDKHHHHKIAGILRII